MVNYRFLVWSPFRLGWLLFGGKRQEQAQEKKIERKEAIRLIYLCIFVWLIVIFGGGSKETPPRRF